MSAVEVSKVSTFLKKNVLQVRGRRDSILIDSWIELNALKNEEYLKYWMTFDNVHHSGFHWPVKLSICLFIRTNSGVYFKKICDR